MKNTGLAFIINLAIIYFAMPINSKERLMVFTRYPKSGTTKTRLIPLLGPDGAADLHRKMAEHTLSQVNKLLNIREFDAEVRYDGGSKNRMKEWLGRGFTYLPQDKEGDLGFRMKRCFEDAFKSGATRAIIIGTDIPGITHTTIQKAFNALKQKPMVLGPATDGGYYLIGFQKQSFCPSFSDLFSDIQWGGRHVLDKTIKIAKDLAIPFSLLEELEDVDRPENLSVWKRINQQTTHDDNPTRISIIIPAKNEADNLKQTLVNIDSTDGKEVILADGGSMDGTVHLAKCLGLKIVNSSPPKSKQMNEGALRASGDILLFLHADTRLPENFDNHVRQCFKQPDVVAGAFELGINANKPVFRLIERLANWRSHRLKLPYGDQAIFVLSDIFHQLDGFPDIPIMEDFKLIKQLRRIGEVITLPFPVITSSRRWENLGILRTTLINQIVIAMYYARVPPNLIARWYHRSKGVASNI
ncbi:MAG: TIGR04283 family arsenosugar biosynthesis glycosyltransferase [Desulfobacterales bacterium]|nr:MAG: TIGR04283 family arsenosugar biosynthesis glycosyltransferase [Desulfobacterales bacterium]